MNSPDTLVLSKVMDILDSDGLAVSLPDMRRILDDEELTEDSTVSLSVEDIKHSAIEYYDKLAADEEPNAPQKPPLKISMATSVTNKATSELNSKDRWVTGQIRTIQRNCRRIKPEELTPVDFPDGRKTSLYRPKVEYTTHEGKLIYVYPSLHSEDGMIGLTHEEYEAFQPGGRSSKRHMLFVSPDMLQQVIDLFKQYSFYTDRCSYPDCAYNAKEGEAGFQAGLERKAQLIVRNLMVPPGTKVQRGGVQVLELKRQCYVHWLLGESRDFIQQRWMQITADLQGLPPAEFRQVRVQRFVDLINEVFDAVQAKAKDGGERPASKEEIGEMLIAFATETQKG